MQESRIPDNIPAQLKNLALEIDNVVQEVVGNAYRVNPSGRGMTYYPTSDTHKNLAFTTVQAYPGDEFFHVYFDPTAKVRVNSPPIPRHKIPRAREIPEDWKWKGSFRLWLPIKNTSDIDNDFRSAAELSFKALEY